MRSHLFLVFFFRVACKQGCEGARGNSTEGARGNGAMVLVIAIEGNIGSGKSELLRALLLLDWFVILEPVEQWGETLKLFYEDPKTHAFAFQKRILECAVEARLKGVAAAKAAGHSVVFVERSFLGAHVFVQAARENGHFTQKQFLDYEELEQSLVQTLPRDAQVHTRVLVSTPVDVCCRRIQRRDREGEKSGPLMANDTSQHAYIRQIARLQEVIFSNEGMIVVGGQSTPAQIAAQVLHILNLPGARLSNDDAPIAASGDATGAASGDASGAASGSGQGGGGDGDARGDARALDTPAAADLHE